MNIQEMKTSRRNIAKGMAWSAPIILSSSAIPAMAASGCYWTSETRQDASSGQSSAATKVVNVPQGTTEIRYTVVGGSGGGNSNGASLSGEFPVSVLNGASSLILSAGSGALSSDGSPGGIGWGSGGAGSLKGTGGGAASALLTSSGTPLIVAGGGGGANYYSTAAPWVDAVTQVTRTGAGGPLNGSGVTGNTVWRRSGTSGGALAGAEGGNGGSNSAVGSGGSAYGYGSPTQSGSAGSGHNGGTTTPVTGVGSDGMGAGGGGGGYFGGGSGGLKRLSNENGTANMGGGGGGGSSYRIPTITSTTTYSDNHSGNGYVTVAFYVCGS